MENYNKSCAVRLALNDQLGAIDVLWLCAFLANQGLRILWTLEQF
jgi:hypothetical protein